jgi:hypothetical protein
MDTLTRMLYSLPRDAEVRWLGVQRMALFTRSPEVIADALKKYPESAYVTINELTPGTAVKHGVKLEVLQVNPARGCLTANEDIARRLLLPFDSDPKRPTGTAATEDQRALALEQSERIGRVLCGLGWPGLATVSTGNGYCLYSACDLPADHATDALLRSFYACAAKKFSTSGVTLDTSVQNRGRIMRLPGSVNTKAGRACELMRLPENWRAEVVTVELLRETTELWRKELGYKTTKLIVREGPWTEAHVEAFMDLHGLDYRPPVRIPAGVLWVCSCPFDPGHTGTSPAIILTNAGWAKWACKHNSCSMKWAQFTRRLNTLTGKVYNYGSKKETK